MLLCCCITPRASFLVGMLTGHLWMLLRLYPSNSLKKIHWLRGCLLGNRIRWCHSAVGACSLEWFPMFINVHSLIWTETFTKSSFRSSAMNSPSVNLIWYHVLPLVWLPLGASSRVNKRDTWNPCTVSCHIFFIRKKSPLNISSWVKFNCK